MLNREYLFQSSPETSKPVPDQVKLDQERGQEAWISRIHEMVVREYPFLAHIDLSVLFLHPDQHELEIRGIHRTPNEDQREMIEMDLGSESHMDSVREVRKPQLEAFSKLLGIKPEQITAELFDTFILLHEFGHAHDFATNFVQNPEMVDISEEDLGFAWREEYARQKEELPIPDLSGSEFRERLETKTFEVYLQENPDLQKRLDELGLSTAEDAMNTQMRAYREIPAEKYADAFAADFIRKHLPEIIADIEGK